MVPGWILSERAKMPKFAANLSMLYTELPFLERFAAAAQDGFRQVEYLFPYEWSTEELAKRLRRHGLQQVLFNLPPGDWSVGERGIACLPERREEFRAGVATALRYADALEVSQLNCLAGLQPAGSDEALLWETLVENLDFAAQRLQEAGKTLLIEPINSKIDMPGFFLDTLPKALRLVQTLRRDNVKIQFDLYHMHIMHGDLVEGLKQALPYIGHVQFADHPGRHEPGTGEIDLAAAFSYLDQHGYAGWISAEYRPSRATGETLGWLRSFN